MSSTTSHPGAEPGHPEYYARLMLPETERDALLHLSNVAHRFYELLELPNEPELHNTRFQWWLEQLSAFREGNASLPALVALQDRQASNASLGNLLQQCLMAVNTEFVSDGFANQEELESFLQQRIGMRQYRCRKGKNCTN